MTSTKVGTGVQTSLASIGIGLNLPYWVGTDGNHVSSMMSRGSFAGSNVFARFKAAAGSLSVAAGDSWARSAELELEYSAHVLAAISLQDHACPPSQMPKDFYADLARARAALVAGDQSDRANHAAVAITDYQRAWTISTQTHGVTCGPPGISGSPSPMLISTQGLTPGSKVTATAQVEVTGSPASLVVLVPSRATAKTCAQDQLVCQPGTGRGNLATDLTLTVVDESTALTVFSGTLFRFGSSAPLTICAIGSTGSKGQRCHNAWQLDELHDLSFTVSFPRHATGDNAYQGTAANVNFSWSRS
jgi:hypothetical protein